MTNPTDCDAPYRFAPHFGRTLTDLNDIVEERISDHRPLLVDLPLDEPTFGELQTIISEEANDEKPKS
ncbi:MAG: hypothetical protein MSG64_13075 [Pyrinomonadaceae bacterium MAG19_C2-C3]|nr:hypothetical protein [Pyrinomonadaceae bacterium MAG19_C2-C3]